MKLNHPLPIACLAAMLAAVVCSSPLPHREQAHAGTPETIPAGARLISIEARPAAIQLARQQDYVQLVVVGRLESGEMVDVTRIVIKRAPDELVTVSPTGMVRPIADGNGRLDLSLAGQSAQVPVACSGIDRPLRVDFIDDVMPVLSKLGCNAGTCHGSKDGKNGFKLSLRGYDPVFDIRALADDLGARRINRAAPDHSLMLLKATGSVPHEGGLRTTPDSPRYRLLRAWIAHGSQIDLASPRVTKIELRPHDPVVPREAMKQQMRVLATYADGHVRDVTADAFISSGNTDVASADAAGLITALRRGEAPVLARFEGAYTATILTVMGDRSGFVWRQPPSNNQVDTLVYNKLKRVKTLPSRLCSDQQFVRRVHLDLTGLPPTADQLQAFCHDRRETWLKRSALVEQLVGSPEYVDHWTNKWSDLLLVNRKYLGPEGSKAFRAWIREHVEKNTPYDQLAYAILTATGSNRGNPAASYFKIHRAPTDVMENTTHLFLGIRFNCNKCHDHPFERWTQDQYYQLAAYFARVGLKADPTGGKATVGGTAVEGAKPLYEVVFDRDSGDVRHERTGQIAEPRFPYEHTFDRGNGVSRREELARWITAKDNRYFARSYVNRIWGYLLGTGIIEPIDDIRAGNPPTNPQLLDWLEGQFVDSGFNVQNLIRIICASRTYQYSIATNPWNEDDTTNYSHAIARRLPAEVLFDAVHRVTGSVPHIPGVPPGTRAAQLPDAGITLPSGFLAKFGRPARESACECERTNRVMLGPVMALLNGPTVADAITDPDGELARLVSRLPDDRELVAVLFLRIVNRQATRQEIDAGVAAIAAAGADQRRLAAVHQANVANLDAYRRTLPGRIAAWEETQTATEWFPLELMEFVTTNGAAFTREADGSWYLSGNSGKGQYTFKAHTHQKAITGIRLEVLADKRLPNGGPGRAADGNFVLSELRVHAAPEGKPDDAVAVPFTGARATFSQPGHGVAKAIDGDLEDVGWAVAPQLGRNHTAIFETETDVGQDGTAVLSFELHHAFGNGTYSIGRFRVLATSSMRPLRLVPPAAELLAIVNIPPDDRTDDQRAQLLSHYRKTDARLRQLEEAAAASQRAQADQRLVGAQDITWALVNSTAFLFNR